MDSITRDTSMFYMLAINVKTLKYKAKKYIMLNIVKCKIDHQNQAKTTVFNHKVSKIVYFSDLDLSRRLLFLYRR